MFERYSFVAITTADLTCARTFWVDKLGSTVIEEQPGAFFIVDVGGLRLCVDTADGDQHKTGSTDPIIGLKVVSVKEAMSTLSKMGLSFEGPTAGEKGSYVRLREPDGRIVVITEVD